MLMTRSFFLFVYADSVFMFDYVSTIISYSLIGIAVFTGKYDGMSSSDLASAVSKVSIMLGGWLRKSSPNPQGKHIPTGNHLTKT